VGEEEGLEEIEYAESDETEPVPEGFSIYEGYTAPEDIQQLDTTFEDEE
jgi:hypothetical protein